MLVLISSGIVHVLAVSMSSFSMSSRIRIRLSMNPFVATRSMRFVVALYSVRKIVTSLFPSLIVWWGEPLTNELFWWCKEKYRRTSGDSSAST